MCGSNNNNTPTTRVVLENYSRVCIQASYAVLEYEGTYSFMNT